MSNNATYSSDYNFNGKYPPSPLSSIIYLRVYKDKDKLNTEILSFLKRFWTRFGQSIMPSMEVSDQPKFLMTRLPPLTTDMNFAYRLNTVCWSF